MPYSYPRATFTGAFGDNATGTWPPAQATIDQGYVTLWVMSQAGWVQRFSLPATQVTVKSAAQRITLVAGGQSFPILADPSAVNRALGWNAANIVGGAVGSTALDVGSAVGRGVNQFSAAQSFSGAAVQSFSRRRVRRAAPCLVSATARSRQSGAVAECLSCSWWS